MNIRNISIQITLLAFANDIILFANDSYGGIDGIQKVIFRFLVATGQKINKMESQIIFNQKSQHIFIGGSL